MEISEIIEKVRDRNFVLDHLFIGMQRESTADIVKKRSNFEGIESYLYIRGENCEDLSYCIKITESLLRSIGIEEADAWKQAEIHTLAETTLISIPELLYEITDEEYPDGSLPLFVLSNVDKKRGASAILNKKILSKFAKDHDTDKIIALPSSIHEFLLLPYSEDADINAFSAMVNEINANEVDPAEQLGDRAFIIEL